MRVAARDLVPVLPLRSGVLFPFAGTPVAVARPGSVAAVERAAAREDKVLAVFGQRHPQGDPRSARDLNRIGTLAVVRAMQRVDDSLTVVVQGQERVTLDMLLPDDKTLLARVRPAPVALETGPRIEAMCHEITELIGRMVRLTTQGDAAVVQRLLNPAEE